MVSCKRMRDWRRRRSLIAFRHITQAPERMSCAMAESRL